MTKIPVATAVIDIGKTNSRMAILDRNSGELLNLWKREWNGSNEGTNQFLDVEGVESWILVCLKDASKLAQIQSVIPVTHGAAAALVTGDDLVFPVLDYEWDGYEDLDDQYSTVRPPFAETYSPSLPAGLNLGKQLFWIQETQPDEFRKAEAILTYPQYWSWVLSGVPAGEVTSLGCHTDLWAPVEHSFSSLVDRMGWRSKFPEVRPTGHFLGDVRPEIGEATGLPEDCQILNGVHDSNASLVPYLQRPDVERAIVLSTGTWVVGFNLGDRRLDALDEARDCLANVDVNGQPVPSCRFMGGREFAVITEGGDPRCDWEDAEQVLKMQSIPYPTFAPGSGPFPTAKPNLPDGWEHLSERQRSAAASLYLAFVGYEMVTILGGSQQRIYVEGALTQNEVYAIALANLSGCPVEITEDQTGTLFGAHILAGGAVESQKGVAVVPGSGAEGIRLAFNKWKPEPPPIV